MKSMRIKKKKKKHQMQKLKFEKNIPARRRRKIKQSIFFVLYENKTNRLCISNGWFVFLCVSVRTDRRNAQRARA